MLCCSCQKWKKKRFDVTFIINVFIGIGDDGAATDDDNETDLCHCLLFHCAILQCLAGCECAVSGLAFDESIFIFHETNTSVPLSTLINHLEQWQNHQLHFEFSSGGSVFIQKTIRENVTKRSTQIMHNPQSIFLHLMSCQS